MSTGTVLGGPGVRVSRDATRRDILLSEATRELYPGGRTMDGALSRDASNTNDLDTIRAGKVVGLVTASGRYAPSIIGVTGILHDTSATPNALTVPAAVAVELDRRSGQTGDFEIQGPAVADTAPVNTETVTPVSINTTTGVIDITGSTTTNDFVAGSFIKPADGSQDILGMVYDKFGVDATDEDATNDIDADFQLLVGGLVRTALIVDFPGDTALIAALKADLRDEGDSWRFDDDH